MTSFTLVPSGAVAAITPTDMPSGCPSFAKLTSVSVIATGEGSGTAATLVNPSSATVKNVTTMPSAPGSTEFDLDTATNQWQYGSASGSTSTGYLSFVLTGYEQGEIPVLS